MKLSVSGTVFFLENEYVMYSPLLRAMLTTDVPLDMDEDGNVLLYDIDPTLFIEYVLFLKGESFRMDEEIEQLFDYMGHSNTLEYPPDVWAMKLRDNWIRDNFYRLELWKDPIYGLIEVPIKRHLPLDVAIPKGWYIAGGAALWMGGFIERLNDIDYFTSLPEKDATESLVDALNNDSRLSVETLIQTSFAVTTDIILVDPDTYARTNVRKQYILRLYKSPSETVHGFDLDCVGIVYLPRHKGGTLLVTQRTMFSLDRRTNWFDPERASTTYVDRLVKYKRRGFSIYLPLINHLQINTDLIDEMKDKIVENYMSYIRDLYNDIPDTPRTITEYSSSDRETLLHITLSSLSMARWNLREKDLERLVKLMILLSTDGISEEDITNPRGEAQEIVDKYKGVLTLKDVDQGISDGKYMMSGVHPPRFGINALYFYSDYYQEDTNVPYDPVSKLILAEMYDFYPNINGQYAKSDYDGDDIKVVAIAYEDHLPRPSSLEITWKSQNPMEQVSSTFHPDVIPDMISWYETSPLIKTDY